ncbi:MAG: glycosyltransferase family 2 protein, partial [Turicibacter sp.]
MEINERKKLRKTILLFCIFSFIYYGWRIFFTIPFGYGWFSLTLGIILVVVELLGGIEFLIHFLNLSKIDVPVVGEVDKNNYPHVDIYIATYNEPTELLYKTIVGCLNMDYPNKRKVHIYVLDDGNRLEMGRLCQRLGVHHLTREDNEHAKAGNLNHALSKTTSPYVVTLDADMIPMRNFLMVSMPFFAQNEIEVAQAQDQEEEEDVKKLGFIQLPQVFYNVDIFQYQLFSEDRIPNEQDYFYRDIELSKNASNSVIYGGSNTILSREALMEIGGFVTDVITEDIATGMLIQSKGYRAYALDSVQASGLAAHDLDGILKQRKRWARGCIQTFRRHNPLFTKGLNAKQKMNYVSSIFYWYGSFKRIMYILAPILFAVFNVMIVKASIIGVLIFWLPMYLFTNYTLRQLSNDVRSLKWTNVYETILAPSLLPAVILETFGFSMDTFEVTKKDKRTETSSTGTKGLAIPHLILMAFTILGIMKCMTHAFTEEGSSYFIVLFWLVI